MSLFQEACKYIPGGVNSPVRAFRGVGGDPLADVARLQNVGFVMKGGEVVKTPNSPTPPR